MPFVIASPNVHVYYMVPSCLDRSNTIDPTKPTVVLLHPRFFDSHFFAKQYGDARLARGYNLVTLDHHYHGQTQAKLDDKPYNFILVANDMLRAMSEIGIANAHIFAASLGSQIAIVMQTLAPERVSSLLLCGLLPEKETDENLEQYRFLRNACFERADDGSDRLPSDVWHALHWIYFGEDEGANSLIEEWVEASAFKPSNKLLITKIFSSILDRTPLDPKLWGAVTCPVLVIHGANDVACPEDAARDIYNMISHVTKELHIIADGPHFLSWTHALNINTVLANFLDQITGVDSRQVVLKLTKKKSFVRRIF